MTLPSADDQTRLSILLRVLEKTWNNNKKNTNCAKNGQKNSQASMILGLISNKINQ